MPMLKHSSDHHDGSSRAESRYKRICTLSWLAKVAAILACVCALGMLVTSLVPPSTTPISENEAASASRESVLLLGDSLTQFGYTSGWVSNISETLVRRAVVVNSGLSGYNTRWVLDVLRDPHRRGAVIPSWIKTPLFATLLLGSNDLGNVIMHVPLDEYQANLKEIALLVLNEVKPKGGLFIMTPPPINEDVWGALAADAIPYYKATREYSRAVLEAVDELREAHPNDVFAVDLNRAFIQYGRPNLTEAEMDAYSATAPWTSLYKDDGLHVNELGGQLLAATLLEAIRASPRGAEVLRSEEAVWPVPGWRGMYAEHKSRHPQQ